jgi:hypothetical protein
VHPVVGGDGLETVVADDAQVEEFEEGVDA